MAEFCLDCWNKIHGTKHSKRRYILSKDLDFCEGCGEFKHVIIMERNTGYMHNSGYIHWLFKMGLCIICFIWKLLRLPYKLYRNKKTEKNIP